MSRLSRTGLTLAAVMAAGVGGYWGGHRDVAMPALHWAEAHLRLQPFASQAAERAPAPSGPVVYYRDPDGKAAYAATPTKTADGRDFRPVLASEDLSFDDTPKPEPVQAAGSAVQGGGDGTGSDGEGAKQVRFYRNPMGLPDTSPVPKKDSMGMAYIPVYAGEEEDGSTIKLSPGKLQRTGGGPNRPP